jgi:hypothetical protein
MGIYHSDLAIRNTITVSFGALSAFKIIDFDKAFKVVKSVKGKDIAFECTEKLFDFWLSSTFNEGDMIIPCDELSLVDE